MNMMKIKSDKVSIVRAHSQGSFLLMNPSIPTSSRSEPVEGASVLCWLLLLIKEKHVQNSTPNQRFYI